MDVAQRNTDNIENKISKRSSRRHSTIQQNIKLANTNYSSFYHVQR